MVAIASGRALEELRWKIGPASVCDPAGQRANALPAENAAAALSEYFDIDETEFEEEEYGPAVGAAS